MRAIMTIILRVIARIRSHLNPPKLPKDVEKFKREMASLSIDEFQKFLLSHEYKSDAIGGLIDKTETWEHFIDKTIKHGRDCDDFAAAWRLWLLYNGYEVATVIITSPKHPFTSSHVIAVAEKDGKYTLCNYTNHQGFKSLTNALKGMRYGDYVDGFIWAIQDIYKLENGKPRRVS